MSQFEVYPLVKMESGWSIPDEVLLGVWQKIIEEDKLESLFYDGTIKTPFEWMEFIKRPGTYPILIVKNNQVVHVSWLKDIFDVGAWAHHVSIGRYQRGAWEAGRDHWRKYYPNIKLLLGLTPETNEKAIKFLQKICKFTVVGKIPLMCQVNGDRVGAIISYYEM